MSENKAAAKPAKAPAAKFGGKGLNIGIAVAAIVTVCGLVLWGMQLSGGFMDTNMRDFAPWGISLAAFMFFVGVSIGSMAIATIPRAFAIEGFGGISKTATWVAIVTAVLGVGFVVVDLGQPLRLWELFAYSNMSSPLMWDIIVLAVYLILGIVYLWMLVRAESGKASDKAQRIMAVIMLVWSLAVITVDAWIFSLMPARAMWNTALMAPWFICSALASGTALVLMLSIALRSAGYLDFSQSHAVKLVKLLAVFVVADLFCFACDLMTEGFPGGEGANVVSMLTTGVLAPYFWVEIIGCALAAIIGFVPKLRTSPCMIVAGVLVLVGIFCKRMELIVGGFQIPALGDAATFLTEHHVTTDWAIGLSGAYAQGIYAPSLHEIGLAVGVVALGVLLVLLGCKLLPLGSKASR